ncbi:MarR family winged helix-turn-helix transcriptional regulator [Streptacidiphilus melanogenes]|uniref:MarR family winged helix-turn-helix transcriptional regulator n=1 Tax=Streptacidiphilus melanogenes TaxID=411235 RepID=UPI0007C6636B|nr:MarR family transcriptional regulator [Streptacidiphilus melanogenes]
MPPTGSADAAQLAAELHAVLGLIARRARAASAATELTASQRSVAARLLREGPATTADLARAEFVRPQSMRMTLGALEERGLIVRTPHPTDGRQVLVQLSEEGRATIAGIITAKRDWLSSAIAGDLDSTERAALAGALPVLRTLAGADATAADADGDGPAPATIKASTSGAVGTASAAGAAGTASAGDPSGAVRAAEASVTTGTSVAVGAGDVGAANPAGTSGAVGGAGSAGAAGASGADA